MRLIVAGEYAASEFEQVLRSKETVQKLIVIADFEFQ
jgi:hypothetical protein